jgi:exodeoxyribonuclease V gamma subunit
VTLQIHRSSRAERLLGALIDVIADGSGDPFAPEVVAVPTRGIERWIAQEASLRLGAQPGRTDGVTANLQFPSVAGLMETVIAGVTDAPLDGEADDPWVPQRLTWTLLDVLDEARGPEGDRLGAFGEHIAGEHGLRRRLPVLRHVARLFTRYALDRPAMVRAWATGSDVDGTGQPLPDRARWQPILWRAAAARLGPSLVDHVADVASAGARGLPHRLNVYGLTALPPTHAEALHALAAHHDVHLYLLHPSPALWAGIEAHALAGAPGTPRAEDPTAGATTNPLLRSWARDSRELQLVLRGEGEHHLHDEEDEPPATLLTRLQHDVRTDTDPITAAAHRQPVDRSVQVHGCHGRTRQVEVLRDVILGLLSDTADDEQPLQPRDIVVMCPDVETYAPLISSVFGAHGGTGDRTDLRVRMADRALRQVNPCLRALDDLLHLPDSRVEASRVIDLLRQPPVMAHFGLHTEDVEVIEQWVEELGIRWGLDLDHRTAHGVPTDAGTWMVGLRRLLIGVAVAEEGPRLIGHPDAERVLPFDDVEGTVTDLAGVLAEVVDRLGLLVAHLQEPRPITTWCADLRATAGLFLSAKGEHAWQLVQLHRLLDTLEADAGGDGAPMTPVTLCELRRVLADQLQGRPTREDHRTGDLTVCTLVPMRSVPYRVICLLGLDDGAYPRQPLRRGDDLIAAVPHVGDHDGRTEDRQLLLDALMAAREHLVITYASHDERTGAPKPPCVPVAELLDVIDATATTGAPAAGPHAASAAVTTHHPLTATDPRAFAATAPTSFDPVALRGAQALTGPRRQPPVFLDHLPPAADPPTTVAWADLTAFCRAPIATYLQHRLGVRYSRTGSSDGDLLEVQPDKLEEHLIGSRLLDAALRNDLDAWVAAERARGTLPAGQIGEAVLTTIQTTLDVIRAEIDRAGVDPKVLTAPRTGRVHLDLDVDGIRVVGAVDGVGERALVHADFGKPKPKRRLKVWLEWLALQAAGEGREALLVGQGRKSGKQQVDVVIRYPATLDPDEATDRLRTLLTLYRSGLDYPLPLLEEGSGHYALATLAKDRDAGLKEARGCWCTEIPTGERWGDSTDRCVQTVFGNVTFDELLAMHPPGWSAADPDAAPTWFEEVALALWHPVCADRAAEVPA